MAHGGPRKGAGRPKGAASAKTREIANKASQEGITPLEYMLSILRDETADQAMRFQAAEKAAPYIHPRLSAVAVGNQDDKPFEQVIRWASSDAEATPDPSKS